MSESQSRYSIVERLTEKKLQIMDEIANVDSKAEKLRIDALNVEQEGIDEVKELQSQITEKEHYYMARIKTLQQEADLFDKSKKSKLESLNNKLTEIDSALKALQKISESAAQESKE